jgi:hypothetical protein
MTAQGYDSSPARAFDPAKHVTKIRFRGGQPRDYLPVVARVMWLRADYPGAVIETWLLHDEPGVRSTWGARVTLPSGASATGFGSRTKSDDKGDYFESGETRALGRALAHLGIATEYIGEDEMDEGRDQEGRPAAVDSGRATRTAPTPLPPPHVTATLRWLTGKAITHQHGDEVALARWGRRVTDLSQEEARLLMRAFADDRVRADPTTGAWTITEPPASAPTAATAASEG